MYEIDTSRADLVQEFRENPFGPYSPELALLVNRLRLEPMAERYVLICTQRGREWMLGRLPSERGEPVERFEDRVFEDYAAATWEVFRMRWHAVTGQELT